MKLYDFVEEMEADIEGFKRYWEKEHHKNPEHFPIEFKKNNEGVWFEMFLAWMDTK